MNGQHSERCECERCFRHHIITATQAILAAVARPDYAPPGATPPPAVPLSAAA